MTRSLLVLMTVGTGLAWSVWTSPIVRAAGQPEKPAPSTSAQARDDEETDPTKRIDKAIAAYERRADQELELTRKEITRLRKELGELSELQYDLAVSLAELQAEIRVMASLDRTTDGDGNPIAPPQSAASAEERQRLRCIELARELRQVQENLRGLVQQKRGETDQLVIQLRNLRAQQRLVASPRAPAAPADRPSRD
jgi:hypothetical protein